MKYLILVSLLLAGCSPIAMAQPLQVGYSDIAIVNAIKKAENSKRYPYGIRSSVCNTEQQCRKTCLKSVQNARKRWLKAGKPGDFIVYLGMTYSPPKINPNWVRLVKFFLKKG